MLREAIRSLADSTPIQSIQTAYPACGRVNPESPQLNIAARASPPDRSAHRLIHQRAYRRFRRVKNGSCSWDWKHAVGGAGGWGQVCGAANAARFPRRARSERNRQRVSAPVALSVSSTTMTATSESLVTTVGGIVTTNSWACVILITWVSQDRQPAGEEGLGPGRVWPSNGSRPAAALFYSSSSLSIESTQMEFVSTDLAIMRMPAMPPPRSRLPASIERGGLDVVA